MPESDPLRILLSHDRWATGRLLDACEQLPAEPFHRRFDLGRGSLHDTLTHVVGAMRTWTESLASPDGRPPGPRLEDDGQRRTPEQLRALHEDACRALTAEAHRLPLDELVTRTMRDGQTRRLTRGAILTHVTTHGTHHRAQCLNMLRQLGAQPLPASSVTEWTWVGEREGV